MNISTNLERACLFFPDKPAILFEGRRYAYRDINEQANRFANALRALDIRKGDRVALFLPNIPQFVMAYYGIQKIGAIAVSLNVMLKSAEVAFILNDSQARAIVTNADLRAEIPDDEVAALEHVIIAEGVAADGDHAMASLSARANPAARAVEMARDDPAAILYTSGTTGFPKGATLSHGNVISNMHSTIHNCGMRAEDRLLLYLPLFHCFGQNFIMNAAFTACATLVMQRRFELDGSLESIGAHKVTMFFGVPTSYIAYLNADAPTASFASVRYYFTAAAKMPEAIASTWKDVFGHTVYEGYGLTETSPMASYNHYVRHRHGSIGTPIENVEMKVVDEHGNDVACGDWGELLIKGPNVMLGYWRRPRETAAAITDGWFHSGDIGLVDGDGYFFVCDRLNDMVITSGFNIYPAEIENVIYGHDAIAEVAVYGIPDTLKGELVKASIVTKQTHRLTAEALIDYCGKRLAHYKVPRIVEFVDSLPKNPAGKILKRILRDQAAPRLTSDPG